MKPAAWRGGRSIGKTVFASGASGRCCGRGHGGNGSCEPLTATADHVRPVWDGGQTISGNIVAACYECNQARGQITNRTGGGRKLTIGDDTLRSPFEVLRAQLEAEAKRDESRAQVKWLIRSGQL